MSAPPYPPGRQLLAGKSVLVTAAAGTGIGFATATVSYTHLTLPTNREV